ncbi:hypothetical protein E4U19_005769 [Claviceps sp. Clav32 group G5]|nr:hypothetical protein E4U19_005769 [Claviceps sp. Clav32 group G5]
MSELLEVNKFKVLCRGPYAWLKGELASSEVPPTFIGGRLTFGQFPPADVSKQRTITCLPNCSYPTVSHSVKCMPSK